MLNSIKSFLKMDRNNDNDIDSGEGTSAQPKHIYLSRPKDVEDVLYLRHMADNHVYSIKELIIEKNYLRGNYLNKLMKQITRLVNLKVLELGSDKGSYRILYVDSKYVQNWWSLHSLKLLLNERKVEILDLSGIGRNCDRIKYLDLKFKFGHFMANIFEALAEFKSLKYLSLEFEKLVGSLNVIESLKECKDLEHLFLEYESEEANDLKDFELYLKNLVTVYIGGNCSATDNTFRSLSKLKNLKAVNCGENNAINKSITDRGVCELINNCQSIREMVICGECDISYATVEALIAVAKKNSSNQYKFGLCLSEELDERFIDLIKFKNLPQNLELVSYYMPD